MLVGAPQNEGLAKEERAKRQDRLEKMWAEFEELETIIENKESLSTKERKELKERIKRLESDYKV